MKKEFSLIQLFSIVDGRLSTTIDDVYDILNHVCDTSLMTHNLPVAKDYLHLKSPMWLSSVQKSYDTIGCTRDLPFDRCMELLKTTDQKVYVPQLRDEFDTSDFANYMVDNSLLINR